jgi:hypothetical protein
MHHLFLIHNIHFFQKTLLFPEKFTILTVLRMDENPQPQNRWRQRCSQIDRGKMFPNRQGQNVWQDEHPPKDPGSTAFKFNP